MANETKHTPGPWKVHLPDSITIGPVPANMDFLIEAGPGDWGGFYVVEHNTINRHTSTRVDPLADARLIAAAPDLLAACEAAIREIESAFHAQGCLASAASNPTHKQLRAAIAKAVPQ